MSPRIRGPHPWEGAFWSDARSGFRYGWTWGWMLGVTAATAFYVALLTFTKAICR